MREIRTLRAMWRVLETEPRQFLTGHEEGNLGYMPRRSLRVTAPVPDPTRPTILMRGRRSSGWQPLAGLRAGCAARTCLLRITSQTSSWGNVKPCIVRRTDRCATRKSATAFSA